MEISVLIPTYQGEADLRALLPILKDQTLAPLEILVTDSSSRDGTVAVAKEHGADVEVIPKTEFNHAGTRNRLADRAKGEVLVFLSQDVRPTSRRFLEDLVQPLLSGQAVAAYARQVGGPSAWPTERFLRDWNYPARSEVRTLASAEERGLEGFFFSNAASTYLRTAFVEAGGFAVGSIQNEDMIMCSRLLHAGHPVAYASDAVVEHTHNYTLRKQLNRYFDIGVATLEAQGDLPVGASTSRGTAFAKAQVRWFWRHGYRRWIPFGVAESAAKFVGYKLGRNHKRLPRALKRKLSMHAYHWDQME